MDLDQIDKRMHSWEYISSGLLQIWYMKFLFYLRKILFLGGYATILMNNHNF